MKEFKSEFEVEGITYTILFNLNVMEAIQEEYGSIKEWGNLTDGKKQEVNVKALKFGLTTMLNEAIDIENEKLTEKRKLLTSKEVGRLITKMGISQATENMQNVILKSTKNKRKN